MPDSQNVASGTVRTVQSDTLDRCEYCNEPLPEARNHNGEVRRFCPGNRCRSAWHKHQKRRALEHARDALRVAIEALDNLLTSK